MECEHSCSDKRVASVKNEFEPAHEQVSFRKDSSIKRGGRTRSNADMDCRVPGTGEIDVDGGNSVSPAENMHQHSILTTFLLLGRGSEPLWGDCPTAWESNPSTALG